MVMTQAQQGPVDSEYIEVWWRQCQQYQTKLNCTNWGGYMPERPQASLHYPDQGNGEYSADPRYMAKLCPINLGDNLQQQNTLKKWTCTHSRKTKSRIEFANPERHKSTSWRWCECTVRKIWPKVNVAITDTFNVWNHRRSQFRLMGPTFTSLSTDEASVLKRLA